MKTAMSSIGAPGEEMNFLINSSIHGGQPRVIAYSAFPSRVIRVMARSAHFISITASLMMTH